MTEFNTGSSSATSTPTDRRRIQDSTALPASARSNSRGTVLYYPERWDEEWPKKEGERAGADRSITVQSFHRQPDILSEVP